MRFILLSLEHGHPFHSLTKVSGIHIQPVINKSNQDQLGVFGSKGQAVEEMLSLMDKKGWKGEINTPSMCKCVCESLSLCDFLLVAVCVHTRRSDCV